MNKYNKIKFRDSTVVNRDLLEKLEAYLKVKDPKFEKTLRQNLEVINQPFGPDEDTLLHK